MAGAEKSEALNTIFELVGSLSAEEKQQLLRRLQADDALPVSIFNGSLSGLEAIVYFLKTAKKKSFGEIATLLHRKPATIYATYASCRRKKAKVDVSGTETLPLTIFSDREKSVLESLIIFLHTQGKSLASIAALLNKSPSTIKTTYWRFRKKCQQ